MYQSKEVMSAILQSIQFGMVIVGRDRRIKQVNKTALKMMGFDSESDIIGEVCHSNICPAEEGKCPILDLGLKVDLSEKVLLDRDGKKIPILKTVSAIELDGEQLLLETFVDITERINAEKKAEATRAFLQTIIDNVAEPIMVFGMDHRVSLMNRAAREFSLGRDTGGPDMKCYQVSHHRDTPCDPESGHPCPLEQVKKTGGLVTVVHEHMKPDGERRFVEIMAAPLSGHDGEPEAVIETSRDITERLNLERQRADFYAMVTHDLKSPLSAVSGYADLLLTSKAGTLDKDAREMVEGIQKSGRKLFRLVEDFLALSRMESGGLTLDPMREDVVEILADVKDEFAVRARRKGLDFKYEVEGRPLGAPVDGKLVQRAVSNLLLNAVNYTPSGGTVSLRLGRSAVDGADFIFISVTDTGPGIPKEDQARVFEKYFRSPNAANVKGSGLGLAIVKAVAEAHGGRVELKSAEGKGSMFRLLLPVK